MRGDLTKPTPKKHHYLPVFLLRNWAATDGKLVEFSKPYGDRVRPKRVFPQQTAYVENLYTLRGFPVEIAAQVEQYFLQAVDSGAANVLRKLVSGITKEDLSSSEISAWSRFMISLMLRMPEDLEILRQRWREKLNEISLEHRILPPRTAGETAHDLFSHAVANPPDAEIDEMVFNIFIDLLNSEITGSQLCNMHWGIVRFADLKHQLYLSDRPIVRLFALSAINGALFVPLSPTSLLMLTNREVDLRKYLSMNSLVHLKDANRLIVSQASKYSYAPSDSCLRFMENHLSSVPDVRAMQGTSFLSH